MDLIPDHASVFIGPGSTEVFAARELLAERSLSITTNSLLIANLLEEKDYKSSSFVFLGGMIEPISMATTGMWAIDQVSSMHFNYSIFGTSGFKGMDGPGTFSYSELAVLNAVMKKSEICIVIADTSKFESSSLYQYAQWDDIDIFITNHPGDTEQSEYMKNIKEKINVIEVKKEL